MTTPAASQTTLGILAGGGALPISVAEAALAAKRRVHIIGLRGAASTDIERFPHSWVKMGEFGRLIATLTENNCKEVVIIGSAKRPEFADVRFDFGALKSIPYFVKLALGGDDHLLSGVIRLIEDNGFSVLGAGEVAPSLLSPSGALTLRKPKDSELEDIRIGRDVIAVLGPFDVGQAVVAADRRVLAIEGPEGTDAMLDRSRHLRGWTDDSRRKRSGALVKAPKPSQDRRVDLPTIGPETVRRAAAAGLAGIGVATGDVLIAEKRQTITLADKIGIFIFGVAAAPDA